MKIIGKKVINVGRGARDYFVNSNIVMKITKVIKANIEGLKERWKQGIVAQIIKVGDGIKRGFTATGDMIKAIINGLIKIQSVVIGKFRDYMKPIEQDFKRAVDSISETAYTIYQLKIKPKLVILLENMIYGSPESIRDFKVAWFKAIKHASVDAMNIYKDLYEGSKYIRLNDKFNIIKNHATAYAVEMGYETGMTMKDMNLNTATHFRKVVFDYARELRMKSGILQRLTLGVFNKLGVEVMPMNQFLKRELLPITYSSIEYNPYMPDIIKDRIFDAGMMVYEMDNQGLFIDNRDVISKHIISLTNKSIQRVMSTIKEAGQTYIVGPIMRMKWNLLQSKNKLVNLVPTTLVEKARTSKMLIEHVLNTMGMTAKNIGVASYDFLKYVNNHPLVNMLKKEFTPLMIIQLITSIAFKMLTGGYNTNWLFRSLKYGTYEVKLPGRMTSLKIKVRYDLLKDDEPRYLNKVEDSIVVEGIGCNVYSQD